jgi:YD repeat-containing protein
VVGTGYDADGNGRRLAMIDGSGASTNTYDAAGRLTPSRNGKGSVTGYGHDAAGNLTTLTYPGGLHKVTRTFDAANRMATITDWLGHHQAAHRPHRRPGVGAVPQRSHRHLHP